MGKGREGSGDLRRGATSASRCRASDDMWLQAAAAAIGALQPEDLEEQRGLFDGEEAVSEGERDAHGARLSELQRAACRRRTSGPAAWCRVYRSCVSRVLRCPCHPCVHAIPVSMPSLCPCHPEGGDMRESREGDERESGVHSEEEEAAAGNEREGGGLTGAIKKKKSKRRAKGTKSQKQRQDAARPGGAREA